MTDAENDPQCAVSKAQQEEYKRKLARSEAQLKRVVVALFSAGWLVPAYMTYSSYLSSLDERNSFDFAVVSDYSFRATCVWLGIVIFAWTIFVLRRVRWNADKL